MTIGAHWSPCPGPAPRPVGLAGGGWKNPGGHGASRSGMSLWKGSANHHKIMEADDYPYHLECVTACGRFLRMLAAFCTTACGRKRTAS